jgi:quinoprotein glucose dehydrogenase
VRTGRKLWEFSSVAQPGTPGNETWGNGWKGRSGTNMWGFSAPVDLKQGIVIVPLGSPAPNYWGGERPGSNLFGNSLVALDFRTGAYKWHFQTVHHDIWDTDQATAGALIDVGQGAHRRPVIASSNKSSLFFVIDRETGKPYLPVEERPVPRATCPASTTARRKPFPVNTPPLSRVSLTYDDIVDAETPRPRTPRRAAPCGTRPAGSSTTASLRPSSSIRPAPAALDDPASRRHWRGQLGRPGGRSDTGLVTQRAGHLAGRLGRAQGGR